MAASGAGRHFGVVVQDARANHASAASGFKLHGPGTLSGPHVAGSTIASQCLPMLATFNTKSAEAVGPGQMRTNNGDTAPTNDLSAQSKDLLCVQPPAAPFPHAAAAHFKMPKLKPSVLWSFGQQLSVAPLMPAAIVAPQAEPVAPIAAPASQSITAAAQESNRIGCGSLPAAKIALTRPLVASAHVAPLLVANARTSTVGAPIVTQQLAPAATQARARPSVALATGAADPTNAPIPSSFARQPAVQPMYMAASGFSGFGRPVPASLPVVLGNRSGWPTAAPKPALQAFSAAPVPCVDFSMLQSPSAGSRPPVRVPPPVLAHACAPDAHPGVQASGADDEMGCTSASAVHFPLPSPLTTPGLGFGTRMSGSGRASSAKRRKSAGARIASISDPSGEGTPSVEATPLPPPVSAADIDDGMRSPDSSLLGASRTRIAASRIHAAGEVQVQEDAGTGDVALIRRGNRRRSNMHTVVPVPHDEAESTRIGLRASASAGVDADVGCRPLKRSRRKSVTSSGSAVGCGDGAESMLGHSCAAVETGSVVVAVQSEAPSFSSSSFDDFDFEGLTGGGLMEWIPPSSSLDAAGAESTPAPALALEELECEPISHLVAPLVPPSLPRGMVHSSAEARMGSTSTQLGKRARSAPLAAPPASTQLGSLPPIRRPQKPSEQVDACRMRVQKRMESVLGAVRAAGLACSLVRPALQSLITECRENSTAVGRTFALVLACVLRTYSCGGGEGETGRGSKQARGTPRKSVRSLPASGYTVVSMPGLSADAARGVVQQIIALGDLLRSCMAAETLTRGDISAANARNASRNARLNQCVPVQSAWGSVGAVRESAEAPMGLNVGVGARAGSCSPEDAQGQELSSTSPTASPESSLSPTGAGTTPAFSSSFSSSCLATPLRPACAALPLKDVALTMPSPVRTHAKRKAVTFALSDFSTVNAAPQELLARDVPRPFLGAEGEATSAGHGHVRDITEKGCLAIALAAACTQARALRDILHAGSWAPSGFDPTAEELLCTEAATPDTPMVGFALGMAGSPALLKPVLQLLCVVTCCSSPAAWNRAASAVFGSDGGSSVDIHNDVQVSEGSEQAAHAWSEMRGASRFYTAELARLGVTPEIAQGLRRVSGIGVRGHQADMLPFVPRLSETLSSAMRYHLRRALNSHMYDDMDEEERDPSFPGSASRVQVDGPAPGHPHHHSDSTASKRTKGSGWSATNAGGIGRAGGGIMGGFLALVPGSLCFNSDDLAALVHRALRAVHFGKQTVLDLIAPHKLTANDSDDAGSGDAPMLDEARVRGGAGDGILSLTDLETPKAGRDGDTAPVLTVRQLVDCAGVPSLAYAAEYGSAHAFLRTVLGHELAVAAVHADGDAWKKLRMFARIAGEYGCESEAPLALLESPAALLVVLQEEAAAVDAMSAFVAQTLDRHARGVEVERRRSGRAKAAAQAVSTHVAGTAPAGDAEADDDMGMGVSCANSILAPSPSTGPGEVRRPRKKSHTASRLASPALTDRRKFLDLVGADEDDAYPDPVEPTSLLPALMAAADSAGMGTGAGLDDSILMAATGAGSSSATSSVLSASALAGSGQGPLCSARVAHLLEHEDLLRKGARFAYPAIRYCSCSEDGRVVLAEGAAVAPLGGAATAASARMGSRLLPFGTAGEVSGGQAVGFQVHLNIDIGTPPAAGPPGAMPDGAKAHPTNAPPSSLAVGRIVKPKSKRSSFDGNMSINFGMASRVGGKEDEAADIFTSTSGTFAPAPAFSLSTSQILHASSTRRSSLGSATAGSKSVQSLMASVMSATAPGLGNGMGSSRAISVPMPGGAPEERSVGASSLGLGAFGSSILSSGLRSSGSVGVGSGPQPIMSMGMFASPPPAPASLSMAMAGLGSARKAGGTGMSTGLSPASRLVQPLGTLGITSMSKAARVAALGPQRELATSFAALASPVGKRR